MAHAATKFDGDRPAPGGLYAAGRNGRRAHRSAAAWSSARVSFATAVRTFSMQWAPLGVQRICWLVAHPTVQQPLHRALRGRRRDRLVAALCRRIIDDQVRLPGDVSLEPSPQRRCLRGRQCRLRHALKRGQGLPDEIQGTLHLTVPEAPADVLDRIGQPRLVRALARRVSGPSLGRLRHVLDAHGEMKPVQYVAGWTDACRLSERARAISAVAQDGHRRARRRAEAMQHTPQLLLLPVRLGRHAAEDDRPALVAADLGHEDLEGAHLVVAHRPHVAAVNAERDRARRGYRSGRLRGRQCRALEPGANLQGPLPRSLDRRGIPQGEERLQQCQGTSVRQRGAHGGNNALILRRATVGHDLRHRRDPPLAGDTAPAWTEAGSTHLHHPEQRDQAPGPPVLERALCPAPVAAAPTAAVLIHLRRDEMALYRGQDRLALLQAEAQRRCGMPGWDALARADLVPLRRAVRPGQLQHDPPPHRAPAPQPPAAGIAPPRFWTVSFATWMS